MRLVKLGNTLHRFDLNNNQSIWFSYETPVAFVDGNFFCIRENEWGPTTGKHLNQIDGTAPRLPGEEFERQLSLVFDNA